MTTKTHIIPSCMALLLLPMYAGCALRDGDGGDEFREALPRQQSVALAGPENAQGGGAGLNAAGDTAASAKWAQFYGFTRKTRDGVNAITAAVLGGVWLAVHTRPSEVSADQATWGPWTDDLSPATYRFVVQRVEGSHYAYRLEGRLRTETDDEAYRAVLSGEGYGKVDERHGDGFFDIDLDTARELDPFENPDGGQLRVEHDLPRDITTNLGALPRIITATARAGEASWSVTSTQRADGGTLLTTAHADLDELGLTALEDVAIASQWNGSGAGRADVTISGGDVPAGGVTAVECWGGDFTRVYYSDSVNWQPAEGDSTACSF